MNDQDISRVERFRQFKNEIRGSDRFLIVGLDIGKNMHHGFLGTATGKTVKGGLRVENSARGFEHLLTSLQFYMDRDGFEDSVFGLEPTSVYHKPLAEFLITHGHYSISAGIKPRKKIWQLCAGVCRRTRSVSGHLKIFLKWSPLAIKD